MPPLPGAALLCPVCQGTLIAESASPEGAPRLLRCGEGHRFDAARQGYFNLLTGRGTAFEADTAAMVQARIDFLGKGHFRPLADVLCSVALEWAVERPVVLDAGAGTGYYLSVLRQRVPWSAAVAVDISKFALRRAARLLPDALCLVWDVWRPLPISSGSVDLLLNIFAPRNPAEFARVMKEDGILLVVTPLPHHLQEIAADAGLLEIRPGKEDDVAAIMAEWFEPVAARVVEFTMVLDPQDVGNVAAMGPAGHHSALVDITGLPQSMPVTAAFTVQALRRRDRPAAAKPTREEKPGHN